MAVNVEYFRRMLVKKLQELQLEAWKTARRMKGDQSSFPDSLDRAAFEHDRSVELEIRGQEMLLIQEITSALERIDRGEFGVCQVCGESISAKRLLAKPTSFLCISCKNEDEKRKKSLWYLGDRRFLGAGLNNDHLGNGPMLSREY
jgi:DnaK suppressor protein